MTEKNNVPEIPEELRGLFGNPPLLEGEDPKLYQSLLEAVIKDREPQKFMDWIAIYDLVPTLWEELRLKRASTGIIRVGMLDALEGILGAICKDNRIRIPKIPSKTPEQMAFRFFDKDEEERKELRSLLAQYGITEVEIQARAAQLNSDAVQMFEGMISAREKKRRRLRKEQRQIERERRKNKDSSAED